jgi:hypothetical protein
VEDAKTFFVLMTDSFRNEPVADERTTEDGMDGAPDAASTDVCVRTSLVDGDTGFTPRSGWVERIRSSEVRQTDPAKCPLEGSASGGVIAPTEGYSPPN